jgi:hypothetical protein
MEHDAVAPKVIRCSKLIPNYFIGILDQGIKKGTRHPEQVSVEVPKVRDSA